MVILLQQGPCAVNTDGRIHHPDCRWKWRRDRKYLIWCRFSWCRALKSLSGRSFHIGLSDRRRPETERGRVWEIFSLEPVGEQERKCTECLFFFFSSHTFVFSRHPGRWEAPNTPAHLPCPPLCVRTKIVEGLCLSFTLAPKPPEARFFIRHCQKWTYSPASL